MAATRSTQTALDALAALAQETRLAVFRLLVRKGPNGLPAGAIARALDTNPPTLSFHLAHLERAGLLRSRRVQRQIFYAADYGAMSRLLGYLTQDCCGGRPEVCAPLAKQLRARPGPRQRADRA